MKPMRKLTFFAVRDDDTSFFTDPDELESVYSPYFGKIPISLAVVPFSVPVHRGRSFNPAYPDDIEVPLGDNTKLVDWLKKKIKAGEVEIMLHGYSHRYRKVNDRWVGEYGWKPEQRLLEETGRAKQYLETLLETRIQVFVPPGNCIGKAGIRAVRQARMNLSGIMGRGGDRPWSWDYPAAYFRRWIWRLFKNFAYPFPLAYGGIKELRAYAMTPRVNAVELLSSLESCAYINAPFVVATHYWDFQQCPEMHQTLSLLIEKARKLRMAFAPISQCFCEASDD